MSNLNHNGCFFFFLSFASEMKLASFSEKRLPPIMWPELLKCSKNKNKRQKECVHDSEVAS